MKTITLSSDRYNLSSPTSSKGNQSKWSQGSCWYKADGAGCEGLAEVLVSSLLQYTNIAPEDYVQYTPVRIVLDNKVYSGCESLNFKNEDEEIITLEKLIRAHTTFGLAETLARINGADERIRYTVSITERLCGITDFGTYISTMLAMDAFFLNEDRHTNNIALLYNHRMQTYRPCPFFDMGLSLLADTSDYPLSESPNDNIRKIKAKPFDTDFDAQLDAAEKLYGRCFCFTISQNELIKKADDLLSSADICELYSEQVRDRVRTVLQISTRKYRYLFPENKNTKD